MLRNEKPRSGDVGKREQRHFTVHGALIGERQRAKLISRGDGGVDGIVIKRDRALQILGRKTDREHARNVAGRVDDDVVRLAGERDRHFADRFVGGNDPALDKIVEAVVE